MRVLVLGGSGHIGSRLCVLLRDSGWATPISASTRRLAPGVESLRLDARDPAALRRALIGADAVVNCLAGNASAIAEGTRLLSETALASGCRRLVHLSTMAVYGRVEGTVDESVALDGSLGWYARAKCEAERHVAAFVERGGNAVVLRPGCVWGTGSSLWVDRIGKLLRAGRLGDLGVGGDGWSNLVHVDDVANAVMTALRQPELPRPLSVYNLAAPDSPRWNEYFVDLALAIGATPVRRLSTLHLRLDALVASPVLKVAQLLAWRLFRDDRTVPVPLPPNLIGLWERHLRLSCSRAEHELGLRWTPYEMALQESAAWFLREEASARRERAAPLEGSDSWI